MNNATTHIDRLTIKMTCFYEFSYNFFWRFFAFFFGFFYLACSSPALAQQPADAVFDITPYQIVYPEKSGQPILVQDMTALPKEAIVTLWDGNGMSSSGSQQGSWITLRFERATISPHVPIFLVMREARTWHSLLVQKEPFGIDKAFIVGAGGQLEEDKQSPLFSGYRVYKFLATGSDKETLPLLAFHQFKGAQPLQKIYLWRAQGWQSFSHYIFIFQITLLSCLAMLSFCLLFVTLFGTNRKISFSSLVFCFASFCLFVTQWHYIELHMMYIHGLILSLWVASCAYYLMCVFSIPSFFVPISMLFSMVFVSFLISQLAFMNPILNDMLTFGLITITVIVAFFAALYHQYSERIIPFFFSRKPAEPTHLLPSSESATREMATQEEQQEEEIPEDGLWVYDLNAGRIHCSKELTALLKGEKIIGDFSKEEWEDFIDYNDRVIYQTSLKACLEAKSPLFTLYFRCRTQTEKLCWLRLEAGVLLDIEQKPVQIQGILSDMTAHKEMQLKLMHESIYDMLTGLPNRALFVDRFTYHLKKGEHLAVIVLDFDIDPILISQLGSSGENALITILVQKLVAHIPKDAVATRISGVSFACFIPYGQEKENIITQLRSLYKVLCEPILAHDLNISLKPAFGITFYEGASARSTSETPSALSESEETIIPKGPDADAESLIKEAEMACFLAKRPRFDSLVVFEPSLRAEPSLRWNIEQDLEKGLKKKQFCLVYQPIFQLTEQDEKLEGFHVELQWNHARRGVLTQKEFMPLLGEGSLSSAFFSLSRFILEEATERVSEAILHVLPQRKEHSCFFSIELTTPRWTEPEHADEFFSFFSQNRHLHLSIPELFLLQNPERMLQFLKNLKEKSPHTILSLGRFTGASLAAIIYAPFHIIHLDPKMAWALAETRRTALSSLVKLLHDLGKKVFCDQMNHKQRLSFMHEVGCDFVSGSYFSTSMSSSELVEFLKSPIAEV